jgi:hypothetical protein
MTTNRLKDTLGTVVTRLRGALDFATHDQLKDLQGRVDELSKKVDKLVGEKVREKRRRTA